MRIRKAIGTIRKACIFAALSLGLAVPVLAVERDENNCPKDSTMAKAAKTAQNMNAVASAADAGSSSGSSDSSKTSWSFLQKLNSAAKRNAVSCRERAKFLGGGESCGNKSKGRCVPAVRETLAAVGIKMPHGDAINQKKFLETDSHFQKLPLSKDACAQASPGVVCLYSTTRHAYGHIEIKSAQGTYCSDFCSWRPSNQNPKGKFKLIGVYRIKG